MPYTFKILSLRLAAFAGILGLLVAPAFGQTDEVVAPPPPPGYVVAAATAAPADPSHTEPYCRADLPTGGAIAPSRDGFSREAITRPNESKCPPETPAPRPGA